MPMKPIMNFRVGTIIRGISSLDARRGKALSALGLRIVRFRNDEVVRDVSAVVGKIKELIAEI